MSAASGSFTDLKARLLSAIVMVVVGISAIWIGGFAFLGLAALVAGAMIWELVRMLSPGLTPGLTVLLGALGAASVLATGYDTRPLVLAGLLLAPILGALMLQKDRALFFIYATAMLIAVAGLFWTRQQAGLSWAIWLVLVVIAADIGGYFFGRILGGPKILPVISPKKTWSGTLGGWLLAALVGFGFMQCLGAGALLVALSVLVAIASQIGDVVESAIKRHTGIKDSSNLIPGHGGFLDRFDALIGASLLLALVQALFGLAMFGLG